MALFEWLSFSLRTTVDFGNWFHTVYKRGMNNSSAPGESVSGSHHHPLTPPTHTRVAIAIVQVSMSGGWDFLVLVTEAVAPEAKAARESSSEPAEDAAPRKPGPWSALGN